MDASEAIRKQHDAGKPFPAIPEGLCVGYKAQDVDYTS